MKMNEIANKLTSDPDSTLGTGASEAEIEAASHQLSVPIAGGYREFLRRFGWGGVPGYDIWGLGDGVPAYLHVVTMTLSERTEVEELPLPQHLLPIMNDGAGNLVCLDTKAPGDEPPVVMWYHDDPAGSEQTPARLDADFLSWLADVLARRP